MKAFLSVAVGDIRFVIGLFFILRFFGLTNAPLEVAHNWRQTDMMMVAKNLAEDPASICFPRVDYEGAGDGIVGMEFPLVNELIAISIKTFGFSHWYGRLINLILSSIGVYFFYLVVLKLFDKRLAFAASYLLLASMWFAYTRKILPDTVAVSFLFASVYYALCYFEKSSQKYINLLLSAFLLAFGGLVKISSFVVMALLLPVLFDREIGLKQKIILAFAYAVSLCVIVYWYFVWVPYLNTLSSIRFFMGNSLTVGLHEIVEDAPRIAMRFYETALGYLGFCLFIAGLIIAFIKKEQKLLQIFAGALAMQFVLLLKVGNHFGVHSYYILPFVPLMALVAGYALKQLPVKYIVVFGVLFWAENFARYYNEFIIRTKNKPKEHLSELLDKVGAAKSDLIAVNGNGNPALLYFSGRKGWLPNDEQLSSLDFMSRLFEQNCKYAVLCKLETSLTAVSGMHKIYEDDTFYVFSFE